MTGAGLSDTATFEDESTSTSSSLPLYYVTSPEPYPGPTQTAQIAPFLAQTDTASFASGTIAVNFPLQTSYPISGDTNNSNIFQLMGHLSPYSPNPDGFGVNEYFLPPGANISTVHLLSRHGSRYPTTGSSVPNFGSKIYNLTTSRTAKWTGALSFLNSWKYTLGAEILVARGRQELFDSGVLFYYNYGQLYDTSKKLLARTTTQDRMIKSAEYFLAGMFGFDWTDNVTIINTIEMPDYNNSLAGYYQCNNSNSYHATAGTNASLVWESIYLADAVKRLSALSGDYEWTTADAYNAQTLCPYETVAYGYSNWCNLFTYDEWQGFEYSIALQFSGNDGFQSPVGRAIGIGYVEELYARLQGHFYDLPPGATNANVTIDTNPDTFPLGQSIYMDFSHDTNIFSIITALGLRQFADHLSNSTITPNRNVTISHITPFGARMIFEQITTPKPVKATRPKNSNTAVADYYDEGHATQYMHITVSQRTVPLGYSIPNCGLRDDGWCEMGIFMNHLERLLETARYEYSCFGNYTDAPYGEVDDGKFPVFPASIDPSITDH